MRHGKYSRPASRIVRPSALALAMALSAFTGHAVAQTAPAAPAPAEAKPDPAKVVAKVNGVAITEADLAVAAEDPSLSLPGMSEAQKRDLLIGYLVDLKIGARAAEAAKVGDSPTFARRLAYFRDKLLLDDYLEREVQKAVTPEAARKLYDETAKAMKPEPEVRARHVLVESEDEAKKIAARIKGGEDFAKIAAEVSKDPGSKEEGGDLGFFTQDRMVKPFADTAFKLEPGQVSDPVQSQFGWHVIKVEEKRVKPVPTFDEMKEQIDSYLARKAQQDLILSLREKAKVERLDKPAEAPAEPKKN